MPSIRRLALVASCLAVLGIGAYYLSPVLFDRTTPESPAALIPPESGKSDESVLPVPETTATVAQPARSLPVKAPQMDRTPKPPEQGFEQMADHEVTDTDYLEFQVIGPDNRPVSFRWPNKYRARNGQTLEEYYLRNVSH